MKMKTLGLCAHVRQVSLEIVVKSPLIIALQIFAWMEERVE